MAKELIYLEKMKRGLSIRFIIHTAFLLLSIYAYFRYESIIRIPVYMKIVWIIIGLLTLAVIIYTDKFLLLCPYCHKSFSSSMKYRLFATKVIPHRCPHCTVVIDYTE